MHPAQLRRQDSILAVVDLQKQFLEVIHEAERVQTRALFLARIASLLEIPVLATEQNPERLGATVASIAEQASVSMFAKMCFSCAGSSEFMSALETSGRKQVVLVGVETHICVCLTALDLMRAGYEVFVCPDAVSSRTLERHKLGMERVRDSGGMPAHSETVAYEWLGSAEHPKFREALKVVKASGW